MKIFYLRRRWLALLVGAAACAAIFGVSLAPGLLAASAAAGRLPISCVRRDQKQIAMTFDAVWDDGDVEELAEVLDKYHVAATFFVTQRWMEEHPMAVQRLSDAGHEVAGHADTGVRYSSLTTEEIVEDVSACRDKIERETGQPAAIVRCPNGEYDDHVIAAIRSLGMEAVQWDVDSFDWRGLTAEEISERVTDSVRAGSIVRFHTGSPCAEALPAIIEQLMQEGYAFVPVSELLLTGDYTVDAAGRQCPAEAQQ